MAPLLGTLVYGVSKWRLRHLLCSLRMCHLPLAPCAMHLGKSVLWYHIMRKLCTYTPFQNDMSFALYVFYAAWLQLEKATLCMHLRTTIERRECLTQEHLGPSGCCPALWLTPELRYPSEWDLWHVWKHWRSSWPVKVSRRNLANSGTTYHHKVGVTHHPRMSKDVL